MRSAENIYHDEAGPEQAEMGCPAVFRQMAERAPHASALVRPEDSRLLFMSPGLCALFLHPAAGGCKTARELLRQVPEPDRETVLALLADPPLDAESELTLHPVHGGQARSVRARVYGLRGAGGAGRVLAAFHAWEEPSGLEPGKGGHEQELLRNTKDCVALVDPSGVIVAANAMCAEIRGIPEERLVGSRIHGLLGESGWNRRIRPSMDAVLRGEQIAFSLRSVADDRYLSISLSPRLGPNGEVQGILFRGRDITAEKASRDELAAERRRFMGILEGLPAQVNLKDANYVIRYANQAFRERYGEGVGRRCFELVHGKSGPCASCPTRRVLAEVRACMQEEECDGRWALTYVHPYRDEGGELLALEMTLDTTDLGETKAKLAQSLRQKDVLLKEVHHRVKNNLQVISSLLSLQSHCVSDPSALEALRDCGNRIRCMARVHEALYGSPDIASVDLNTFLDGLSRSLAQTYTRPGVEVLTTGRVSRLYVPIDTALPLGLIVNELVSNAMRHAFAESDTGVVELRLMEEDDELRLEVADTGRGLPEGFSLRADRSMGLQLVAALSDQLKGEVEAENEEGATFRLRIPRGVLQDAQARAARRSPVSGPLEPVGNGVPVG